MLNPQSINLEDVQVAVDKKFPSPEEDLIQMAQTAGYSPEGEPYVDVRFLVVEVDDLISQLRWHLGQALLLLKQYPWIEEETKEDIAETEGELPQLTKEFSTRSQLLLRGYIARPEQVLFTDLSEKRKGDGTVAGWIYHMMIDDAVTRSLAILDRLARIVCLVGNVPFSNGKVYFRSKKLTAIHKTLNMPETQRLLDISTHCLFDYILNHRDGWNHENLTYSDITGFIPADSYIDPSGQHVIVVSNQLTGELLFALARAAYDQVVKALHEVRLICEQKVPKEERTLFSENKAGSAD